MKRTKYATAKIDKDLFDEIKKLQEKQGETFRAASKQLAKELRELKIKGKKRDVTF